MSFQLISNKIMQESPSNDSIVQLDERYEENVRPYETIVKTIGMHNEEIYALQEKYAQLQQQYEVLKQSVQPTALDEQRKKQRQRELKKERNRFIEQAITVREKEFNQQYQSKRYQRLQEITLKYQQISLMQGEKKDKFNIFFNLQQGLLEEVMQELGESGQQSLRKEIGSWLASHKTSMKSKIT